MPHTIICPSCQAKCRATENHIGRNVACPKCKNTIQVPDFRTPSHVPPPPIASAPPIVRDNNAAHERTPLDTKKRPIRIILPLAMAVAGVGVGCVIGFYAAHHFAFFGGFALLGNPYSPARYSLVPGHMLLCGVLVGAVGCGLGVLINKLQE